MKIAYGTYAMPTVPLEDAIPALADIGYDGVELCVSPKNEWLEPDQVDADRRGRLRGLIEQHGLGVPAMFMLGHILANDDAEHHDTLERMAKVVHLARDLGVGERPVIAIGIGGRTAQWEEQRHQIVARLADYAALAEREGFILAGEAHCNAAVDRSERIEWLFGAVNHPAIRFHFDIVHLFLAGEDEAEAVARLLPYTAHTHITDAIKRPDGKLALKLLGQGGLDTVAYLKAMKAGGWTSYITIEVSTMIWSQPDYDPIDAAKFCYGTLSRAFTDAGVERT